MNARFLCVAFMLWSIMAPHIASAQMADPSAQRPKLRGLLQFPESPGRHLETYCNIHGPSASSAEYEAVDAEVAADPALKQRWVAWSQLIVDQLRTRWSEIATVEGDCDVVSIKISNRHIEFGPDDCFPHNQLIVPEVAACLRTLEGESLLDLPRGTSVKRVVFFASFAAGRGATKFDWKPQLAGAQLFGYECPFGATSHESLSLTPPQPRAGAQTTRRPIFFPINIPGF